MTQFRPFFTLDVLYKTWSISLFTGHSSRTDDFGKRNVVHKVQVENAL